MYLAEKGNIQLCPVTWVSSTNLISEWQNDHWWGANSFQMGDFSTADTATMAFTGTIPWGPPLGIRNTQCNKRWTTDRERVLASDLYGSTSELLWKETDGELMGLASTNCPGLDPQRRACWRQGKCNLSVLQSSLPMKRYSFVHTMILLVSILS